MALVEVMKNGKRLGVIDDENQTVEISEEWENAGKDEIEETAEAMKPKKPKSTKNKPKPSKGY